MTTDILSFILILSVLLFGAVEIWSSTVIILMVYTLGLAWIIRKQYTRFKPSGAEKLLYATGAAFAVYTIIQVLPLPASLLEFISPNAFDLRSFYSLDGSKDFMCISVHPYKTRLELLRVLAFLTVLFISMQAFKDMGNVTRTLKILVVFGFCLAVFGILQKVTWNGKIYWFRELTFPSSNPFGPFVNRNHFAGFIGMLIPLGLGLLFTARERSKKILFGFLTLIMSLSVFFSLSRGGIIGFFVGIALFSILIIQSRTHTRRVWAIGIFLVALTAYLLYLGIDPIVDRFYNTDLSTEQRLIVWSATLNAFKDFWLTGSGLGTFMDIFPLYSPVEIQAVFVHAHNDYVEFMLETGAIGIILLITFISLSIYITAKSGPGENRGILRIAAVSSVFTMMIHSFVDFNLHILSNALLFFAILGMAIALSTAENPGTSKTRVKKRKLISGLKETTPRE